MEDTTKEALEKKYPTTVIMPNMLCFECNHMWRGGPSSPCPEGCKDAKTSQIENLDWFPIARKMIQEIQKTYPQLLAQAFDTRQNCEDVNELFHDETEYDDSYDDDCETYVDLYIKTYENMFHQALLILVANIGPHTNEKNVTAIMNQIDFDGKANTNCPKGCEVEPDGYCPHGYDSLAVLWGLI